MTTAQDRLNSILPSWYELLAQWSLDGSLVGAATEALVLDGSNAKPDAKGQLQSLTSQWSAGNFKSLPQIVVLSGEDMAGVFGAYADSTDTIYLNADWLLTATEEQIQKVLTEELGHSLDDQLNLGDTKGDEGEYLSYQLFNGKPQQIQIDEFRSDDDQIYITDGGTQLEAQASISGAPLASSLEVANSVSDYSGIQGQGNWYYGYYDRALPTESQFKLFETFTGDFWIISSTYYTNIDSQGGHPHGPISTKPTTGVEHWIVRRWVSESSGNFTIQGIFDDANKGGGGDGVQGFITVNGQQVYSQISTNSTQPFNYSLNLDLAKGDIVDFVTSPRSWDGDDSFIFTASISAMNGSIVIRGNSVYSIVEGPTWEDAELDAEALGGHLVSIGDSTENEFVRKFIEPYASLSNQNLVYNDIGAWIGFYYDTGSNSWKWKSGEEVSYSNFYNESNIGSGFNYAALYAIDSQMAQPAGYWNDHESTMSIGVAEIPLTSSITFSPTAKEGQTLTTTISLSAGTLETGNLAEAAEIHWRVTGITADDLTSGSLTGSGTIVGGQLVLTHGLKSDVTVENENFVVTLYSDALMTSEYQIGTSQSAVVADNKVIRANSLYVITDGLTWTQAEENAVALGGNLVTINDSAENAYLLAGQNRAINALSGDGFFWLGIQDSDNNGTYTWSSGQEVGYTSWFANEPSGIDIYGPEYYGFTINFLDGDPSELQNGFWYDTTLDGNGFISKGIAEIPLTSSITFSPTAKEGQTLTTTISLSAGTLETGNLAEGLQVWWMITGVSADDFASGISTGNGFIVNGKLDIQHTLLDDSVFENEQFEVSVFSDAEMQYQIGDTYSVSIADSTPASVIGTAMSDASTIIISGDLTAPSVESYSTTTSGRGKNKITVGEFNDVTIDKSAPVDALVVNGGASNNTINGNGFVDNASTAIDETRSAFIGVLVIDGKGGADTITGGTSGTNWLIGGGVTTEGTVDTLTGVALSTDIFDLRRNAGETWEDAYSVGNAVINGYDLGDYIVLAKDQSQYQVINQTQTIERLNKRGKVIGVDTVTYFEIKDIAGDLIATVNGLGFTPTSSAADLKIVYDQNSQDPFEVVLPSATPGTII